MSDLNLTGNEMLAWAESTSTGWRSLVTDHPEILVLACDIYTAKTVGQLLQHVVAVELRYAQRLATQPETPYEDVPFGSADEIYATHDRAVAIVRSLLDDPAFDWHTEIEFKTLHSGTVRASRKAVFFHAQMHGIRHYAQLATLVRQHGLPATFTMDYLVMGARRV